MEIAPGIHNVLTEGAPAPGVTNTYLVVGRDGAIWVDTGWDREGEARARIDYWRKAGSPRLQGIVVTHRHPPHWGNAPAIRQITGAAIIASPAEKPSIEERMAGARVDRVVEDGEVMPLGDLTIEFVHAPGHTYGSLAVFIRETRALFTGDNVMGTGTSVINPGDGEIGLFLQTMAKFIRYDPAVIYPGQGPVITDPRARLEELIRHRHEREAQIVGLLEQGPRSVPELYGMIYSGLNDRLANLARNQIRSHLLKLEREGRVSATGELYRLTTGGSRPAS
jgi:endoribonuclease LACTB2